MRAMDDIICENGLCAEMVDRLIREGAPTLEPQEFHRELDEGSDVGDPKAVAKEQLREKHDFVIAAKAMAENRKLRLELERESMMLEDTPA